LIPHIQKFEHFEESRGPPETFTEKIKYYQNESFTPKKPAWSLNQAGFFLQSIMMLSSFQSLSRMTDSRIYPRAIRQRRQLNLGQPNQARQKQVEVHP
jgi:hypothetical protein